MGFFKGTVHPSSLLMRLSFECLYQDNAQWVSMVTVYA